MNKKPTSGIKAKDPNSKTSKLLAKRTKENMKPDMIERRDKFIDGLLKGMSKAQAAIYAGATNRTGHKAGSTLWCEPYVQERFRELREALEEEQLLTRKEQILNLKSIAFDDDQQGNYRVSAHSLLSRVMGFDSPIKIQSEVDIHGSVMLVPMANSNEEWEAIAKDSQQDLKMKVRD